jgi:hypothetical protein
VIDDEKNSIQIITVLFICTWPTLLPFLLIINVYNMGRYSPCVVTSKSAYTARNATDLLQVADFTDLLQVVNKLQQAC